MRHHNLYRCCIRANSLCYVTPVEKTAVVLARHKKMETSETRKGVPELRGLALVCSSALDKKTA